MIHTVKGFSVVNEAEIDVFLELSCFFYDPKDVGNLISGSSPFLILAWTSGSSEFTYCSSLAWRILSITLLVCEMSTIVLTSQANKLLLKILQASLQQYVNLELPDVQAEFRKGRGTRDQIANIRWIIKKARDFQNNI